MDAAREISMHQAAIDEAHRYVLFHPVFPMFTYCIASIAIEEGGAVADVPDDDDDIQLALQLSMIDVADEAPPQHYSPPMHAFRAHVRDDNVERVYHNLMA